MGGLEWDATAYDRVAEPQFAWATSLLGRHAWRGEEHVLDAGSGPGRVAQALLERLPRGRLTLVDVDPGMVEQARRRFAHEPRVKVERADLHAYDGGPFDVVFSNAVLHWVPDHARLFRRFHALLRPSGWLVAQGGGAGNIQRLVELADEVRSTPRFQHRFHAWSPPWHFEGVTSTRERLERAGFSDVDVTLTPAPVDFPDRAAFLAFAAAAPLVPYTTQLGPELAPAFRDAVADAYERQGLAWRLEYVRLTLRARRT